MIFTDLSVNGINLSLPPFPTTCTDPLVRSILCIARFTSSLIRIPVAYKAKSIALSLSSIAFVSSGEFKINSVSLTVSVVGKKNPDFGASMFDIGFVAI